MNRRFEHIPEAEFQVLDGIDLRAWVQRGRELLASNGTKGFLATEGLIFSDLVSDPVRLRQYYQANRAVVDGYFNNVDVRKVIRFAVEENPEAVASAKSALIGFAAGAALIGGVIWWGTRR